MAPPPAPSLAPSHSAPAHSLTPGSGLTAGTLTFNNDLALSNGSSASFKLTPNTGPGNDLVNVSGNLNLSGTIGLNILALGAGPTVGNTYTLFNYSGTLTGNETNFSVAGAGARTTYTVVPTSTTPNAIEIQVSGSPALALTYIGNVSSNWSLQGDLNFKDASANPQKFFNLDMVTFDDTSSNNNPVQIIGNLQPGGVTVTAARDYTFAGTGSIGGTIALTKANAGNLTVTNNNTYSGGTNINGGTVNVGNGGTSGSIGAGNVTLNGGNLNINRSDNVSFPNIISGSGNLIVSGTGTLSLNTVNTFNGTVNINAGTTKINTAASLGTTLGGTVTIAPGATLDLGGDTTANDAARNFQSRQFVVSGTGVGGVGAITNTGVSQQNAFNNIQLAGDTTFSGFRFDIGRTGTGTLDLAGHTLTVNMNVPAGSLFAILTGTTVTSGNILVNTGGISIERNAVITDDGSSTITYMPNTNAFFFAPNPANITRKMIYKGGNIIGAGDATATSAINNPMTLNGSVTLEPMSNGVPAPNSNFPLALQNNLTESGGSFAVNKLGVNTNILSGPANSWSGASTLAAGTLEFAPNAASGTSNSSIGAYTGNGTLHRRHQRRRHFRRPPDQRPQRQRFPQDPQRRHAERQQIPRLHPRRRLRRLDRPGRHHQQQVHRRRQRQPRRYPRHHPRPGHLRQVPPQRHPRLRSPSHHGPRCPRQRRPQQNHLRRRERRRRLHPRLPGNPRRRQCRWTRRPHRPLHRPQQLRQHHRRLDLR